MCRLSKALGAAGWECQTCKQWVYFHSFDNFSPEEITAVMFRERFKAYPHLNHNLTFNNIGGNATKSESDISHYAGNISHYAGLITEE